MKILLNLLLILAYEASTTRATLKNFVEKGNYVFKTFTEEGLYENAKTFCRNDGGWIAEPVNADFNNALQGILTGKPYWIGLRRDDDMVWQWQQNASVVGTKDGGTCSSGYCNWNGGDGDDNGDTYAAITNSGLWIDVNLNYNRKFACQYVKPPHKSDVEENYVFKSFVADGLYEDAETFCRNDYGWIAEPTNANLNTALYGILETDGRYWIGLRCGDDKVWQWQRDGTVVGTKDGSGPTCADGYCNWYGSDGDDPDETYAAIDHKFDGWIDISNEISRKFACQYGCYNDRCQHGGTCMFSSSDYPYYSCTCANEFEGYNCEDCKNGTCQHGGICQVTASDSYYSCLCAEEFDGNKCQNCKSDTCQHGGTCTITAYDPYYTCTCTDEFDGDKCQNCSSDTCQHGGTCYVTATDPYYSCTCAGVFDGNKCQNCKNGTCQHGGTCHVTAADPYYSCACTEEFDGNKCQNCKNDTCQHGGTCHVTTSDPYYRCACRDEFEGNKCQDCKNGTCMYGGTCVLSNNGPNYYSCDCIDGYYGTNCNSSHCDTAPCENGGSCSVISSGFYYDCTCPDDYFGYNCTESYCDNNPCENDGSCSVVSSEKPYYNCTCPDAYFGYNCTESYCDDNPCENGGSCSVVPSAPYHNCSCPDDYYGYNCTNFLKITSTNAKAIAVEGYVFYISATVKTIGYNVTVTLYFDDKVIKERTNVGDEKITFKLDNITESSEGNYTFYASPPQNNYTSTSSTNMTVHVEARIKSVSTEFIFSPITAGPDYVTCEVYGKPPPDFGWYMNGVSVKTTKPSSGVYQTFDNDTNVVMLHVANANLTDDGAYVCRAKNQVGDEGRNVTRTNTTVLAVYGPPTIESTEVTPCTDNGEITINWRPNSQTEAVAHNMTILKGKILVNSQILSYSVDATIAVSDLEPNTEYNTTITVCPDECISFLNDAEEKRTGDGTPGEVASAKVTSQEITTCIASWEKPKSPNGEITGYVVEWTSSYVYEPSGDAQQPGVLKKKLGADDFRNEIKAQPNRLYNATVYAKTCAGDGEKVDAVGSCTTPPASPDNTTAPDLADKSGGRTSILPISIPGIDETNGQVSCVYVVVQKDNDLNGKIFTPNDLATLQQNAENEEKSSYLALAFRGYKVGPGGLDTMLGDDTKTSCNAISADHDDGRKRREIDKNDYQGTNVLLDYNGAKYLFLTLIATPVGDAFVLIQSPPTLFTQGESLVWVTGVVLAVVVLITIPVIIYMRRNQDRMKNDNSIPMDQPNGSSAGVDHNDQLYENVQKDKKIDRKITLKMLENIYRTMKSNESMQFREEYNELRKEAVKNAPPCNFGKSEAMMKRNRYKNIIPYDSTRVVLQGEGVNSYINACYVKGPQRKFIATQGPLPHTVNDFWRMVVEQRCRIIVMLTRCQEAGKRKCEQYWPNPMQAVQHGQYNIRNSQEKHFGGYVRRELKIYTANNEEHHVYQYQFLRWPDHGVPKTTSAFFRLHKEVMQNHEAMKIDVPILVHCSAGVGRTGAFIGFDILQAESKKRKFIDIYNCALEMRKQRVDMVQTCEQYELLHKLLLEIYLFGETDVRETELQKRKKRDEGGYRKEFQNLTKAESLIPLVASDNAGYTPGAGNRVVIMRQPEDTEWITIDATFLEAYHHGTRLIAACGPSKSTVEYFWRAILDNDIDAVVMLNSVEQQNENTADVKYWPDSRDEEMNLNNLSVRMVTENDIRGIIHRTLVVSRPVRQQQKEIMHFQLLGWRQHSSPGDGTEVLDLLNDLHDPERRPATILVHSSKGIGRAGTFCALFNLLERLKNENMLDVFRAVKDLRELRPGMIESVEQYTFCYDVAMTHLSSRNVYANEAMDAGPADPIYENL